MNSELAIYWRINSTRMFPSLSPAEFLQSVMHKCTSFCQGLWRIEYLNTGLANSPKMWAVQFATSGSTSGSSGSKLTLNNSKINN